MSLEIHEDQNRHSLSARKKSHMGRRSGSRSSNTNASHRRNFPRRQTTYWTSGHEHLTETRDIMAEQSPFRFPSCSQTVAYLQWWKTKKKREMSERGGKSYKDRQRSQSADILQRLRVSVDIEAEEAKKHKDPSKIIAMTDVDPSYFTELSGRPVSEKFSLRQYIGDVQEVLKTKLLIGQNKDECIRIDQQFRQELNHLRKIQHRTQRYMSSFDEFLSGDHKKSMDILYEAEREAKVTAEISERKNEVSKQVGERRLSVYVWEENWRTVKMCQMFLYQISPTAWRIKHDWFYRAESSNSIQSTVATDFTRYKAPAEGASLEELIELFERDVAADVGEPVELYFEDPFDLIRVFRAMETQNLNALVHLESLAAPMENITKTITVTEAQMKQETDELTSTIRNLESSIAKEEERAENLEKYANYLIETVIRRLISSEEVLYLHVFVEDTYESCVGPNDANLDTFTMMKWIERTHEDLNRQLDNLPRDIVRACEKEGFKQEAKIIKNAQEAAKKFDLMHRLLADLKRIMEPPAKKKRPLTRRSAPIVTLAKPEAVSPKPTSEEVDYLTFFTDYCKHEDFTAYRSEFPDDFDLTFRSKREDTETEITNDTTKSVSNHEEQEM
ncbi:cilia- and flagella-associated protein 100-like isoform X2 [Pseudomyrmex gracilis]|uniref:cilia- and flagella-associated protein 100-like isoform X2 n=1 Tax=Pseudomyrmex gracilis TaxID=219809 RepID=UPI000995BF67|nr:cilia- and flagella-associated protein 100-like isoform X2 [Pseudomyrmex gracilis]